MSDQGRTQAPSLGEICGDYSWPPDRDEIIAAMKPEYEEMGFRFVDTPTFSSAPTGSACGMKSPTN